jgi:murein DD-endopeptidase MepM/ murein hydrolase activator NlpD
MAKLPDYSAQVNDTLIRRTIDAHTVHPERATEGVTPYTVQRGDSVFSIATTYQIKPETILWSNFDVLEDDPELLRPGQVLNILPVNGLYYKWQEGDTIEKVAEEFDTTAEEILSWPGNNLNPLDPRVLTGDWVIVPGGSRPLLDWGAPVMVGNHRYSFPSLGPGACTGSFGGPIGSGSWFWPGHFTTISGNDFWPGHPGIDIAAAPGTYVYAADAGVVVFAGWSTRGYGNLVIIDHGNDWVTFYAHLDQVNVSCGEPIGYGGKVLGMAGNTGNSTGYHIHFEMRYMGTPVNPHLYY